MITIQNKAECCGCTACYNICPKEAIQMKPDFEGFLYPFVNAERCVECGLCDAVCPVQNPVSCDELERKSYVIRTKDSHVLDHSTSGGFITPLGQWVIKQNGVICGAAFNNDFKVVHKIVGGGTHSLSDLRGSKYVQSDLTDCFATIKRYLEQGTTVCFVGTTCQVYGLKKFLRKKYETLVTVDLVCHGTPSPKLWDKYLEYQKNNYHSEIEDISFRNKTYGYKKADKIVTISQACVDSFARVYPELRNKVVVLENISSANDIFEKAKEVPETDAFFNFEGRRIVSVGRLSEQKNFQLAVQAAQKLKSYGVNFIWYILGEGELRQSLTEKIKEYDLTDQVKLVGIKPNPYPYIANCDVFVQSSIYEGKSIVLDEAKILCKPIVITNYVTAPNSIESGKNGLIVGMTSDELARGVASYFENEELRKQVVEQLRNEQNSNDAEIEKYIALFTELMESNV